VPRLNQESTSSHLSHQTNPLTLGFAVPRVSVLTPCYNAERLIGATLTSLRAQKFTDWECVVVDDGSSDRSADLVRSCATLDDRIRLIRQANGGVSSARNAAYRASSSGADYLLFLDADDLLEPNMLEVLVDHLDHHPDAGVAYSGFTYIGDDDELIEAGDPRVPAFRPTRFAPSALWLKRLPPHVVETPFVSIFSAWTGLLPSNALLRRSVYVRTPGWDDSIGQPAEDTDLFLHMAMRGRVHYLALPLVLYRRHANQSTSDSALILAQDRKVRSKWARMDGLTTSEHAVIKDALTFHEARVLPYFSACFGASHLRHRNLAEGAKCFLRAIRQWATAVFTPNSSPLLSQPPAQAALSARSK
jgi:glycosyltransferase involved in cell wall biosynthesis